MLQSIRNHTQGWIAGVIISLLILSFALWGIHSYIGTGGGTDTIAKVNGQQITKHQLSVVYERLRRQLQAQSNSAQLPIQAETAIKEHALQVLIEAEVLKQDSISKDYRISNAQLDSFLTSLPEFQEKGHFSPLKFRTVLEANLFNAGEFLELIRTSLLIDQPRLGVMMTAFALPNEVKQAVDLINQERDIRYLILPFDFIKKEQVTIPEDKIKAYYISNQASFQTPEEVKLDFVELNFNDIVASIKPTDEQLKKYYNENSASFSAAQFKKTDASKSSNQVSSSSILPFAQIKDKVKQAYIQQQAEEKYSEQREKLASISYEHPESLTEVANTLGLKIQTTESFTRDKGKNSLTNDAKIREMAFSEDVLNRQNNSDVIPLGSERSIVIRVKSHTDAHALPLESVRQQIVDKLEQNERTIKTKELADNLKQQLVKGSSLDQLAAMYHLNWKVAGYVKRNNNSIEPSILEVAFAMPVSTPSKPTFGIAKISKGYALIALSGVKAGAPNEKNKTYAEQLKNAQGALEYQLYKNSLMHNAKIKAEGE